MSDPMRDRQPPHSDDAEQAVLSAMLMDKAAIVTAMKIVKPESFYSERHVRIFRAMLAVAATGAVVDPLTLSNQLIKTGELEHCGGKDYIGYLVDAVPTAANVDYHAEIVREAASRREVIASLTAGTMAAFDPTIPIRQTAADVQSKLLPTAADTEKQGFVAVADDVWAIMEEIESQSKGITKPGITTGYPEIDDPAGGLQRGEIVFVAGVPTGLKTALIHNIVMNVARDEGLGAAIVSAEMMRKRLHHRALARMAQVPYGNIRKPDRLTPDEWRRMTRTAAELIKLPLWVDETPNPSLPSIAAKCRHLKAQHPELALIAVDYVQLLSATEGTNKRGEDNRALELEVISYGLAGLAKELDVLMLVTVQVDAAKIESRDDKHPRLSDLRWSQAMRMAGHFVWLCYRDQMYNKNPMVADTLEVDVAKARESEPYKLTLTWQGEFMTLNSALRMQRQRQVTEQQRMIEHA